jgi:4-hydroxy-2-oxoheptanedioate aldolase
MAPVVPEVLEAIARVREAARRAGIFAAVHTDGPETARQRFSEGFGFCTLQNDTRLLINAAGAQVRRMRELITEDPRG